MYNLDPLFEKCRKPIGRDEYACNYLKKIISCGQTCSKTPYIQCCSPTSFVCSPYFQTLAYLKNETSNADFIDEIRIVTKGSKIGLVIPVVQKFITLILDISKSRFV